MDTVLRSKSEENTKLANLAIQETYYASSIHCSYYACLQLMKHIQRSDFGMTDEDVKRVKDDIKADSHIFLIGFFKLKLSCKQGLSKREQMKISDDFSKLMEKLKKKRVKADYDNLEIISNEAIESLKMSKEIILILTTYFNL